MNKSVVISGEASETDSEDEVKFTHNPLTKSVVGSVIAGEDSESENEHEGSIDSAISALNIESSNPAEVEKFDGLLQQKLRECNIKLRTDLNNFWQNTIDEAKRSLNTTDQDLLRSQITLQNAVTSLKSLTTNTAILKNKMHSLLTAKFIANVKIDN